MGDDGSCFAHLDRLQSTLAQRVLKADPPPLTRVFPEKLGIEGQAPVTQTAQMLNNRVHGSRIVLVDDAKAVIVKVPKGYHCNWDRAVEQFLGQGRAERYAGNDDAVDTADYYRGRGWIDKNGNAVRDWPAAIRSAVKLKKKTSRGSDDSATGRTRKNGTGSQSSYERRMQYKPSDAARSREALIRKYGGDPGAGADDREHDGLPPG